MTGKTITSALIVLLLIVGGFWMFNRMDDNLAAEFDNNINAEENMTGTGGPDDGYNPLEDEVVESKG